MDVCYRPMTYNDIQTLLKIENQLFQHPWDDKDFKNKDGIIAIINGTIIGYLIYDVIDYEVSILNIGVEEHFQRNNIATELYRSLLNVITLKRYNVVVVIREKNLAAQLLFKNLGFLVIRILKNYYNFDDLEDAYLMNMSYNHCDLPLQRT